MVLSPTRALIEPHYLPCIDYMACVSACEELVLEVEENFPKQTYRNRCYIVGAHRVERLTVPVLHEALKTKLRDLKIDYRQAWIRQHWGALQSAYGKSPFFEYYAPDLIQIYSKKPVYLLDLNVSLLTFCLQKLGLSPSIAYSLSYEKETSGRLTDKRNSILPPYDGFSPLYHEPVSYYQTFGNNFIANMSVVDLLFNTGPEARTILMHSAKLRPLPNEQSRP